MPFKIEYFDAYAGAGKTYALARQADQLARIGEKVMIVMPSKLLIDATVGKEIMPLDPDYPVTAINGDTVEDGTVTRAIVEHTRNAVDGLGEILLVTHSGFLRCPYWHHPERWIVIVDEVLPVTLSDNLQIPDSHALITAHLDHSPFDAKYSLIECKPNASDGSDRVDHVSALRRVSINKHHDNVYSVFQEFVQYVMDARYNVFTISDQFVKMIKDKDKANSQLIYFAELNGGVFDGFKRVVICSALFKDSLMYHLWKEAGVNWSPVPQSWRDSLKYQAHENGKNITVYYATHDSWSKSFRDTVVMEGSDATIFTVIQQGVKDLVGNAPTIWMGNVDSPDQIWAPRTYQDGSVEQVGEFVRLPNSPHGLNDFMEYDNVVVTSALNATPAHFAWMASRGIDGEAVKTGMARSATYQALMRSGIRKPESRKPQIAVVMDRNTATWLTEDMFPGAKCLPLPGVGLPRKNSVGRPRKYKDVDRKVGYRQTLREELLGELTSINGGELFKVGRFSGSKYLKEDSYRCFGTEIDTRIKLPLFTNKYADVAFAHIAITDHNALIAELGELSKELIHVDKEDSALISPAHFVPNEFLETNRGLENITYVYSIWFDCDGGDLTPEKFASLFPYLRMCMYSTFTSTPEKPKWRCFIPTTHSMSIRVHDTIVKQMLQVLNEAGYWGADQLAKNPKIKSRLDHGFDRSKFTPSSMFYLPSRPKVGEPFFKDFNDDLRGPLDVPRWIETSILDLNPKPIVVPRVDKTLEGRSPAVRKLLVALRDTDTGTIYGVNRQAVDRALEDWHYTPRGEGNKQFFVLGSRLQDAGMELDEIEQTLRAEYTSSGSSSIDRRNQIRSIISTLARRGSTRPMRGSR